MKRTEPVKLLAAVTAFIATALSACVTGTGTPDAPDYYVMRHLEKAEGTDPPLSEVGRHNARRLAGAFSLHPPRAIYASTTRRARETAEPVAEHFGLAINEYDPRDTPGLVRRVRKERKPVLIIGHSNTVPAIAQALVGARISPIAEDSYGMMYKLTEGKPWAILIPVDPDYPIVGVDDT
jgi:phosphohistidine phosphatase SixA